MPKAFFLNFNAKGKAKDNAKASLKNAKGNFFEIRAWGTRPGRRGTSRLGTFAHMKQSLCKIFKIEGSPGNRPRAKRGPSH